MNIPASLLEEVIGWRHYLHQNPELGFEEYDTSRLVTEVLTNLGIKVHTGLAKTGVIGILKKGNGTRSIGIRADMDALPIQELGSADYASCQAGKMHACGHDGHTAILLGAATYLAKYGSFDGTVYFIFQPAEENLGGGVAMVEDGLFEQFAIDEIYGLHNWPGRPLGEICVNDGSMMASFDIFDITLQGVGTHAAMPEYGKDPIVAAAGLITAVQSIVSREVASLKSAVLSITQIQGGDTYNIIPEYVTLKGTVRALDEKTRLMVKDRLLEYVEKLPALYGVTGSIDYQERYPATINNSECAAHIRRIASEVFGKDKVLENVPPTMASEDFSVMLNAKKGAYLWLGVDEPSRPSTPLHNPYFDFNDNVIAIGIHLWVSLVEKTLVA
ncbi:M20 aminoacylase family protein [Moraxella ovis]|uniref:M20 aminoacylase family protein n=1 Tax=Moraxella ovis TaxID=29433 RepID=UPI000D917226|nr:M20 aminoacylase family protein [Moraxella ovis]SPX85036.1 Uncharacterized hydrolase YxeP [Moraxella ovis]STZ05265.1 Uncharacterized hydrolase YxeP [Moraxella ovis]